MLDGCVSKRCTQVFGVMGGSPKAKNSDDVSLTNEMSIEEENL